MQEEKAILPIGTVLNNGCYKIQKKLGKGGFGITYLAEEIGIEELIDDDGKTEVRSLKSHELVVIKELFFEEFCNRDTQETRVITITNTEKNKEWAKLVEKQKQEGRYLRALNHKHIVKNKKIFLENGTAYIVMEYLEGIDLEEIMKKSEKLSLDKALKYTRQVLSALHHVHQHNILHLDVKPSNIFIRKDSDDAVLIDFGASLAYEPDGKVKNTTSKLVSGVSYYAATEQNDIDNLKAFDATLDTFSLAGTFYHMITGVLPPKPSLRVSGRAELILPNIIDSDLSDYFDALISKGLSTKYHDRFSSSDEFVIALDNQNVYERKVKQAQTYFAQKQYHEALKELKIAAALLGETKTTNLLKEQCEAENKENSIEQKYEEYFKQALQFETNRDFENALVNYQKANKENPGKAECVAKIDTCKRIIEQRTKQQQLADLWMKVRNEESVGKYEKAIELLNKILDIDANNAEAFKLKNQLESKIAEKKEYEKCKKTGADLEKSKKWDEALTLYLNFQSQYPQSYYKTEIAIAIDRCKKTRIIPTTDNRISDALTNARDVISNYPTDDAKLKGVLWQIDALIVEFPTSKDLLSYKESIEKKLNSLEFIDLAPDDEKPELKEDEKKSGNKLWMGLALIAVIIIAIVFWPRPRATEQAVEAVEVDSVYVNAIDDLTFLRNQPKYGELPIINSDTIKNYNGNISSTSNLPHGEGEITYINNDIYKGHFIEGKRNGNGKYTFNDKSYYEGEFKDNLPINCIHYFSNGEKQGEIQDGKYVYFAK